MIKRIVGVDPGREGSLCTLTVLENGEQDYSFELMPFIGAELDYERLCHIFSSLQDAHFFIEHSQAMPKNGAVAMFNYGKQFGTLLALAHAFKITYTLVRPTTWTKILHEGISHVTYPKPKQRSLIATRRLFPHLDLKKSERCKFPHEGKMDALLIAEYGRRALTQTTNKKIP